MTVNSSTGQLFPYIMKFEVRAVQPVIKSGAMSAGAKERR